MVARVTSTSDIFKLNCDKCRHDLTDGGSDRRFFWKKLNWSQSCLDIWEWLTMLVVKWSFTKLVFGWGCGRGVKRSKVQITLWWTVTTVSGGKLVHVYSSPFNLAEDLLSTNGSLILILLSKGQRSCSLTASKMIWGLAVSRWYLL